MLKILQPSKSLPDGKPYFQFLISKLNLSKASQTTLLIFLLANFYRVFQMKPSKPKKPPNRVQGPEDYEMPLTSQNQSRPQTRSLAKTINLSSPSWVSLVEADEQEAQSKKKAQKKPIASSSSSQSALMSESTILELVKLNPQLKETEPIKSLIEKMKGKTQNPLQSIKPVTPADFKTGTLITQATQSKEVVSSPTFLSQSGPKVKSKYFTKQDEIQPILLLEPEFDSSLDPNIVAKSILPESHLNPPLDILKTQKFYEFILVDTNSVEIKHYTNKEDASVTAYSTCKICKILTPTDFGGISKIQKFSKNFNPPIYSYWDYQQAWYRMFYLQNPSFNHSWMIFFKKDTQFSPPLWFTKWWEYFGAIHEIFPQSVAEGFNYFISKYASKPHEICFQKICIFCMKFGLAWICKWEFCFQANQKPYPASLARVFKVKWWDTYNASSACLTNVQKFLNQAPSDRQQSYVEEAKEKIHLASQKTAIQNRLSMAKSPEDLMKVLHQIQSELSPAPSTHPVSPDESRAESQGSTEDFAQENEDTLGLTESQYRVLRELEADT